MNCPHCGKRINVGKLLRSNRPTAAQKEAARLNGLKGGRPKTLNRLVRRHENTETRTHIRTRKLRGER